MKQTITHEISTDEQGRVSVKSRYQEGTRTRTLETTDIFNQVALINVIGNHVYRFFLEPERESDQQG